MMQKKFVFRQLNRYKTYTQYLFQIMMTLHTRARRFNRSPNVRIRSDLVVVENDISNSFFVLINNKRRVKILEILWDFRGDSVTSEMLEILSKSRP